MDRNYCANTNLYTVNDLIVNFRGSMRGRLIHMGSHRQSILTLN